MAAEQKSSRRLGRRRTIERGVEREAKRTGQLFKVALGGFLADRCTQMAASISYYALFALFPLVILAAAIFGTVQGEAEARQSIIDLVTDYIVLTPEGERTLESALEGVTENTGVFGAVGLVGLLFSASGVMSAIRNALNTAFDVDERRPPVHGKLVDMTLVLFLGLAVGTSLALTLFFQLVPDLGEGEFLITTSMSLLPIAINFGIFSFLFYVMPATEVKLRDVWPGALFAALGYEAAKIGFAFYLSNFGNYSAVYGSVAVIIIFMFFVYIVANIFLLGGEMASEWGRVKRGDYDRARKPDQEERDISWDERAMDLVRKIIYRRE